MYYKMEKNKFAYDVCVAVSQNPGKLYNPLYLYGEADTDKEYLLETMLLRIKNDNPEKIVRSISISDFEEEMIAAVRSCDRNVYNNFRNKYRKWTDVLILTEVERLETKGVVTQEEIRNIINELFMAEKQVIAVAKIPAKDLKFTVDGLQGRLQMGIVVGIKAELENPKKER